jgi:hypothetical protein
MTRFPGEAPDEGVLVRGARESESLDLVWRGRNNQQRTSTIRAEIEMNMNERRATFE